MLKNAKDIFGFDEKWVVGIGYPLSSLIISILLFNNEWRQGDWRTLRVCVPLAFFFTGVYWLVLRQFLLFFFARYPSPEELGKRMILMSGAYFLTYFLVNSVIVALITWAFPNLNHQPDPFLEFFASILITALVVTVYEALRLSEQLKKAAVEKADLVRQNVESQLEGLRNQVNPHFLFNSLNTLTYLIPDDQEKAVRFVQQLSRVYRYILDSRDDKIIPLQEELDFLKSYIFLLKERFGQNLNIEMHDICEGENCAIVPLSLQMLFENAIKHNVISKSQPLDIQVFVENHGTENENIIVQNSLQRKETVSDSTGVGLENIADRYRILTGKSISVEESKAHYRVAIPLIRMGLV